MRIIEADYSSIRQVLLGLDVQSDVLSLFANGGQLRWMIGALLVIGGVVHILRILNKEGGLGGLIAYFMIVPMIISWGFFRTVGIEGVQATFDQNIEEGVRDAEGYLIATQEAVNNAADYKNISKKQLETRLAEAKAALEGAKAEQERYASIKDENGGLRVPVLYAFFYTMSAAFRWSVSDAFMKNLYDKNGTAVDANAKAKNQIQMIKAFAADVKKNPTISPIDKLTVSNLEDCIGNQAALKKNTAALFAEVIGLLKPNGRTMEVLPDNIDKLNEQINNNIVVYWNNVETTYQVCNSQGKDMLKALQNDLAIKAEAAEIKSSFFPHWMGGKDSVSENQRIAVAKAFQIPVDKAKSMSMDDIALYVAYIKHLQGFEENINGKLPPKDLSKQFDQNNAGSTGVKEELTGIVARFLNGFAMWGKSVSIESYHFILFLFAISFPFAMLMAIIPGMHLKMIGGYFAAMLFIQMWGLGYGMVDVYYGKQFSSALTAEAAPLDSGDDSALLGWWNSAKAGAGGVADGIGNAIDPDPVVVGLGAYMARKKLVAGSKASLEAGKSLMKGLIGKVAAQQGIKAAILTAAGIAAGPAVVLGTAASMLSAYGDNVIAEKDAGLQYLADKLTVMNPATQTVYNGAIQWSNIRMEKTIDVLDGIMAWMYTMVPMFVAFTFFGFYKAAVFLDLGKQGAQLGQQVGTMTALMATRGGGNKPGGP